MASAGTSLVDAASKKQSIELVRIFILLTLSNALWYRDAFKGVEFDFRVHNIADPRTSYETFIRGPVFDGPRNRNEPRWPVLLRNQSKTIDQLLDYLENGVKEALENGLLSKLQLSLHKLDKHPPSVENLIESFALGFEYKDGIPLAEITAKERNHATGTKQFSVGDVKNRTNYLLKEIDSVTSQDYNCRTEGLSLPDDFCMILTMKHVGVKDYRPVGFHASDANSLILVERTPLDLKLKLSTGHHTVLSGMILPRNLPAQGSRGAPLGQIARNRSSAQRPNNPWRGDVFGMHRASGLVEAETQSEVVAQIETMGISRAANGFNTQPFDTPLVEPAQLGPSKHDEQNNATSATYTQAVFDYVERSQSMQSHGNRPQQIERSNTCECQARLRNAKSRQLQTQVDTIRCIVCDGYRHLDCYGYAGTMQPQIFVCYSCLEAQFPFQQTQLQAVQSLCLKRRALHYFLEKGSIRTIKDIATYLNCPVRRASEILHQLKIEKYIDEAAKSKQNGRPFTFSGQREKAIEEYFNPRTGMEEFLTAQNDLLIEEDEELEAAILEATTRQLTRTSAPSIGQTRIFRTPNAPIHDETSTQGTPSPHPGHSLVPDPDGIATLASDGDTSGGLATRSRRKRKVEAEVDVKPANHTKKVRPVPGSIWRIEGSRHT